MMAIATLNTSVDVPDNQLYKHLTKGKSATVNEVESIVEYVAEFVVHSDFKFAEKRNDDSNGNHLAKKVSSLKYNQNLPDFSLWNEVVLSDEIVATSTQFIDSDFVREITPPPPKA